MKIRNFFFAGAFAISILGAFAFKTAPVKLAGNAALPSACNTLVKNCAGGTAACTFQGQALKYSNGITCTTAATMQP